MRVRHSLSLIALFLAMSLLDTTANAQDQPKKIEHTTAAQTSPASGQEMFMSYCASCHGKDAKGNGPAASALKIAPANLTRLARDNEGKYPSNKVTSILSGQTDLAAHGNKEMPVWGKVFWSMSGGHAGEVQQRIANLNRYIESLQVK
jgi:mono/diheme cytochrome c family protein